MLKKGYARPSFAADSALRIRRRFTGTCLIAYLPPTIAAQIIGSVGVRQAAITRHEMYVRLGKRARMMPCQFQIFSVGDTGFFGVHVPATTTHPNAIVGTTMISRPLTCRAM